MIEKNSLITFLFLAILTLPISTLFAAEPTVEVSSVTMTDGASSASTGKKVTIPKAEVTPSSSKEASSIRAEDLILMEASQKKNVSSNKKSTASLETKKQMFTKNISGQISARGPMGIALEFEKNKEERSAREMYFPYEQELKLDGYKTKMEIQEGDRVTVTYEEAEDESQRLLKAIKFDHRKPAEEEKESEDSSEKDAESAE